MIIQLLIVTTTGKGRFELHKEDQAMPPLSYIALGHESIHLSIWVYRAAYNSVKRESTHYKNYAKTRIILINK